MQLEYPEVYDELFMEQAELLREVLTSKMYATQQLESQKLLKKELEENKERQGQIGNKEEFLKGIVNSMKQPKPNSQSTGFASPMKSINITNIDEKQTSEKQTSAKQALKEIHEMEEFNT